MERNTNSNKCGNESSINIKNKNNQTKPTAMKQNSFR